ncbi:MAG: carboxymuconolactone decarboxylase family protein [Dongiaceae bacterium]
MTDKFPLHDLNTAPAAAREDLAAVEKSFGMITNLERIMASSPALLKGHNLLWDLFAQTTLTPIERQVVYQTANFENECDYCVPWHTQLSEQAGMAAVDVAALREGQPLSNAKLEALRTFTRLMIHNRGKISQADLDSFFAAGYTPVSALEVVLGLAIKVMTNYTNSIAGTPLDACVRRYGWHKPRIAMRQTG